MKPVDLMAEVPLEIVLNSHSKRKTSTAVSYFEVHCLLKGPRDLVSRVIFGVVNALSKVILTMT